MDIIKKYKPEHYEFFQKKIEIILSGHKNIDSWVCELKSYEIIFWIKILRDLFDNNPYFIEEYYITITLIIKLFMLELDVETKTIKLKNNEIKKLIKRFYKIICSEYLHKTKVKVKDSNSEFTLLK